MNSKEFLEKLDSLLQDIPQEEREEAVHFYSEYFSEAGPFQEQAILEELVSPEHVANLIKKSLPGYEENEQPWQEPIFNEQAPTMNIPLPIYARQNQENAQQEAQETACPPAGAKKEGNKTNKLLLILVIVLTFPIWISILSAVLGIAFSVVISGVAFLIAGGVAAAACLAVLFLNMGALTAAAPGTGLLAAGILLLSAAICMALAGVGWFILFRLIPMVWQLICKLVKNRRAV